LPHRPKRPNKPKRFLHFQLGGERSRQTSRAFARSLSSQIRTLVSPGVSTALLRVQQISSLARSIPWQDYQNCKLGSLFAPDADQFRPTMTNSIYGPATRSQVQGTR